ncbi:MAG: GIY-YIG nuclease family protein [Patescibacteria group bacterium]
MKYFIYIAYNKTFDKFYIGQTNNLARREFEHNNKLSKYTAKYSGDWKILYTENYNSRAEAMRREKFLKNQKNKDFYRKLCSSVG